MLGKSASGTRSWKGHSSNWSANNELDPARSARAATPSSLLTPDCSTLSSSTQISSRLRGCHILARSTPSRVSPVRTCAEDRDNDRVHCSEIDSEKTGGDGRFGSSGPSLNGRLRTITSCSRWMSLACGTSSQALSFQLMFAAEPVMLGGAAPANGRSAAAWRGATGSSPTRAIPRRI